MKKGDGNGQIDKEPQKEIWKSTTVLFDHSKLTIADNNEIVLPPHN